MFILMIKVRPGGDPRQTCEELEGSKLSVTIMREEMLRRNITEYRIEDISDFMDMCNDQLFDLEEYFIGYFTGAY